MHYVHTSFCAFYFINVRLFITRSRKYWHFSRPHVFVFGHVSDTDTWPTRPDTCRTHLKRVQNYFGNFFEIRTRPNTASEHGGVENVIFFEENASFFEKEEILFNPRARNTSQNSPFRYSFARTGETRLCAHLRKQSSSRYHRRVLPSKWYLQVLRLITLEDSRRRLFSFSISAMPSTHRVATCERLLLPLSISPSRQR